MANGLFSYDEIRFDVRDPELTHVYVYIAADHNCPHTVQGWYHKAYPASRTTQDILSTMLHEDGGVLAWAKGAPHDVKYIQQNTTIDGMTITEDVTGKSAVAEACALLCDERAAYYGGDDDGPAGRRAIAAQACADVIRHNFRKLAKPTHQG